MKITEIYFEEYCSLIPFISGEDRVKNLDSLAFEIYNLSKVLLNHTGVKSEPDFMSDPDFPKILRLIYKTGKRNYESLKRH